MENELFLEFVKPPLVLDMEDMLVASLDMEDILFSLDMEDMLASLDMEDMLNAGEGEAVDGGESL